MIKHGEEGWGNLCDVYKDRKLSTRVCVCVCARACLCVCLGLHLRIRGWHEMYKKINALCLEV